jgi:hypothetical protein
LSLIFRNASVQYEPGDVAVTRNVDISFGQLAYYTLTATAPAGTAKVRVQSSTTCNTMKMDAFCLRISSTTGKNGEEELPATTKDIPVSKAGAVSVASEHLDVTVNPNRLAAFLTWQSGVMITVQQLI